MLKFSAIPFTDGTEFEYEISDNQGLPAEYSYMYNLPPVLNQGEDPICVPCSTSAWLNWKINIAAGKNTDNSIELFDIFKGGNGSDSGMTCKGAFKYLIDNGVDYKNGKISISKYYKVSSKQALKHAIVANGPCVAVLPVYDEYSSEFWKKTSDLSGYHAVSVIGYDEKGFIIRNSWGRSYGRNGYFHISNEDINKMVEIWTLC